MSGTIKANVQLGDSVMTANNFTLTAEANDGTMKLARGNKGATTQDVMTVDAAGKVSFPQGSVGGLTLGTAQATTSGTSIDFTGIPSWVKRITVNFSGVSTSGTSVMQIQLGDSGGLETTGYLGTGTIFGGSSLLTVTPLASGFIVYNSTAAQLYSGRATLELLNQTSNLWSYTGVFADSAATVTALCAGSKALSTTLDRVRLTTFGGTDTFDAGSVNIMYEG